jgi:hypothetical protein
MKTIRALAALTIVTAGTVVAAAGPAAAKGPQTATLTGPGIDDPVVVGGWGATDQDASTDFPAYLHLALYQFTSVLLHQTDDPGSSEPPAGEDLGPKYTLTWTMSEPSTADPADYTIVQELYPATSFERSHIHTLANRYTASPDRWTEVDPVLADILDAYSAPTADDPEAVVAPAAAASASTDEPSSGIHPLATLAATAATFAAGLTLGRRRRWPWTAAA